VSRRAQRIPGPSRAAGWLIITAVLGGCAIFVAIHSYVSRRTITSAPPARSLPLARGDVVVATAGEPDGFGAPRRVRGMAICRPTRRVRFHADQLRTRIPDRPAMDPRSWTRATPR
jgi:hypothetical protein